MFFLLTVRSKESKAVSNDGSLFGVLSEHRENVSDFGMLCDALCFGLCVVENASA